ncbi:MAG: sigma-70 family RNA polymerase sigma factor [Oscillospiraceae bacterium]|nr:sigma-70 family RNA polymerase sigma factor [Oscillospiraceae bacterium]MDD4414835.1 sigma-70 family RNA polymerase sigma factor [Oscillospiraceae bacterium]
MDLASSGTNDVVKHALHKYSNMVRRICFMYLHNREDVEDVFQEVFLKLLQSNITFQSEEHEKAWLCRITINKCKDVSKSFWRKNTESIEDKEIPFEDREESGVLQAVLSLPKRFKEVVYLFYYEGYTAKEIAKILNQKENTVYSNLHRARELLKHELGGSGYEYTF